jgi:hypothetical protein
MDALEVLQQARALISDPARWTQGFWARDRNGAECSLENPYVCRWCAAGAINKVTPLVSQGGVRGDALVELEYAVADLLNILLSSEILLFDYNDTHTHAEVLALFDAAIARLESAAAP